MLVCYHMFAIHVEGVCVCVCVCVCVLPHVWKPQPHTSLFYTLISLTGMCVIALQMS